MDRHRTRLVRHAATSFTPVVLVFVPTVGLLLGPHLAFHRLGCVASTLSDARLAFVRFVHDGWIIVPRKQHVLRRIPTRMQRRIRHVPPHRRERWTPFVVHLEEKEGASGAMEKTQGKKEGVGEKKKGCILGRRWVRLVWGVRMDGSKEPTILKQVGGCMHGIGNVQTRVDACMDKGKNDGRRDSRGQGMLPRKNREDPNPWMQPTQRVGWSKDWKHTHHGRFGKQRGTLVLSRHSRIEYTSTTRQWESNRRNE